MPPIYFSSMFSLPYYYEGPLKDGKPHGQGRQFYVNHIDSGVNFGKPECGSLEYEGGFVDGKWEGQGKWFYASGTLYYEGGFRNGTLHGWGKKFLGYNPGEGYWAQGEGPGWLVEKDGKLYLHMAGKDPIYYGPSAAGRAQSSPPAPRTGAPKPAAVPVSSAPPARTAPKAAPPPDASLDSCLAELNGLIGLRKVKQYIRDLVNLILVQQEHKVRGLPVAPMSYHLVFTGSPGTGKTTVARLIGKIYAALGIVSRGNVVETDRTGLVSHWVGHTAKLTDAKINEARGGILFIDEAYALTPEDDRNDFGQEAVDCLLKRMEDYRDDFVVIAAGYEAPMQRFLKSNSGLISRFNHHIRFEDYTLPELVQILERDCKESGYLLRPETRALFQSLVGRKLEDPAFRKDFSNGRYVRNLFEKMIISQSSRLAQVNFRALSNETFTELLPADLQAVVNAGDFDRTF